MNATWSIIVAVALILSASNIFLLSKYYNLENEFASFQENYVDNIQIAVQEGLDRKERVEGKSTLDLLKQRYQKADNNIRESLIYGSPNAKYTLNLFSDIECPYCRKIHPGIKQIVDHSQGVINWMYLHFPLQRHNPTAAKEAQAIECIAENQGNQYAWIALEQFMASTSGGGKGISYTADGISEFVRSFGLNGSMLKNCLLSDDHKEKINQQYSYGRKLGIDATPAILIVDNETGKKALVKGYKTPEELLSYFNKLK